MRGWHLPHPSPFLSGFLDLVRVERVLVAKKNTSGKVERVRPVELHDESELFEWETPNGTIRIPFIENLPMGVVEDAEGLTANEFIPFVIGAVMDAEAVKVRRLMTVQGFNKMIEGWEEASAIKIADFFVSPAQSTTSETKPNTN